MLVFHVSILNHEFRHNIIKVAVDLQTSLTMLTKFIVKNRTDTCKTDINLFFTTTNC